MKLAGFVRGIGWFKPIDYCPPPRLDDEPDKQYYHRTEPHRREAFLKSLEPEVIITGDNRFFDGPNWWLKLRLLWNKIFR